MTERHLGFRPNAGMGTVAFHDASIASADRIHAWGALSSPLFRAPRRDQSVEPLTPLSPPSIPSERLRCNGSPSKAAKTVPPAAS